MRWRISRGRYSTATDPMKGEELTRDWIELWSGTAALARRLDDCPPAAVEFFETLAEYGGRDDVDSIQVEFTTLTDSELVWIEGALRQLRKGLHGGHSPALIVDAVDAFLRRTYAERQQRSAMRH